MARLIRLTNDSNNRSSWETSSRLVSAMAAWDASDSARLWSACEKGMMAPVFGSRAPAFELELAEDGKRYRIAGRIDGRVERLAGAEPAR